MTIEAPAEGRGTSCTYVMHDMARFRDCSPSGKLCTAVREPGPLASPRVTATPEVPRIPASAGAMIFDPSGRLLILKPTYKKGWTIPGGQIDSSGESPWDACRRETREECGLVLQRGRLACVDYLP